MIVSLALFLTALVMGPALQSAYDTGIKPLVANQITAEQRRCAPKGGNRLRTAFPFPIPYTSKFAAAAHVANRFFLIFRGLLPHCITRR